MIFPAANYLGHAIHWITSYMHGSCPWLYSVMAIVMIHTKGVAKMHSELQKVHDSEAQGFIFYVFFTFIYWGESVLKYLCGAQRTNC